MNQPNDVGITAEQVRLHAARAGVSVHEAVQTIRRERLREAIQCASSIEDLRAAMLALLGMMR